MAIYAVDSCRSFHACDAIQDRQCEPATWTRIARRYDLTLDRPKVTQRQKRHHLSFFSKKRVRISPHSKTFSE